MPSHGLPRPEYPEPVRVASCGQRCDKVRVLREGVYPGLSRWASNAIRDTLRARGTGALREKRRRPCDHGGRDVATSQGAPELPEAGGDKGLTVSWNLQRGRCIGCIGLLVRVALATGKSRWDSRWRKKVPQSVPVGRVEQEWEVCIMCVCMCM